MNKCRCCNILLRDESTLFCGECFNHLKKFAVCRTCQNPLTEKNILYGNRWCVACSREFKEKMNEFEKEKEDTLYVEN